MAFLVTAILRILWGMRGKLETYMILCENIKLEEQNHLLVQVIRLAFYFVCDVNDAWHSVVFSV
jgi:hypothetical protein